MHSKPDFQDGHKELQYWLCSLELTYPEQLPLSATNKDND